MKKAIVIFSSFILTTIIIWWRAPIIGNECNKQTFYIGLLDTWYGLSNDNKAYAMWIDDDSTEGVFMVKEIADAVGIPLYFAVIADKMEPNVADSLVSWQHQGAGIVLHGLRHERWWNWSAFQIETDFHQSYKRLHELGFDTTRITKMVVPPHGCNNRTIREVVKKQGFKMISGASLINPDRHVCQFGRIGINLYTDLNKMREMLQKAYDRKAFVIFGTHSSIPETFSAAKTKKVMQMAKEIGFCFDIND